MRQLLKGSTPLMLALRAYKSHSVVYGFGDASGEGFGSWLNLEEKGVGLHRRGFWCTQESEESSNHREFRNLLLCIQEAAVDEHLKGTEVWLFTDNQVAEGVIHHATSHSQSLYELMLELKQISLENGFILKLVHITGTRMIAQGKDGLSRGELHIGALLNKEMINVPLHLDPISRSPKLLQWCQSWSEPNMQAWTPLQWFHDAHQEGMGIWSLPPAAALDALEELSVARLVRPSQVTAIVLVPQLLQPEWRRRFVRCVDLYFVIAAGSSDIWPSHMHESLLVGISFPILRHEPWEWKRVPFMVGLGRQLSSLHKDNSVLAGDILHKFWSTRYKMSRLSESMVCKMLHANSWQPFLGLSGEGRRQ